MKKTLCISSSSVLLQGEAPDLTVIPPAAKRRLSPIQKIYFSLASAAERAPAASTVFATRNGEDVLTRQIVETFQDDGSVSPHKFSASVYNAAPGLWSVYTRNRSAYTAIAAREDSLEIGLLEALAGVTPALFVYAEETGGGYGTAVLFCENGGERVSVDFRSNPAARPISFDLFAGFLKGSVTVIEGRFLRIEKIGGR